ncbi:MAG: sulfurtransferase TusA family protein [Geminicoccaceae bacterium]
MAEYNLDITEDTCPITFVKTKLKLEEIAVGDLLTVRLRGGEPMINVPRSVEDHGHQIVERAHDVDGCHRLIIRKMRD